MIKTTTLTTSDGPMMVHWALPAAAAAPRSLPGILVFQEAFGVNHHIQSVCERLASAGYVAAAPELFHREGPGTVFEYDNFDKIRPVMSRLSNGSLLTDIRAAYGALSAHSAVNPQRTYSIGFCLGGFASILAALNLPLAAAASFYGGGVTKARQGMGLSPLLEEFPRLQCPTLHVFGEKDTSISQEDVGLIRARLEALHKPYRIEVYPEAGHGFLCEERSAYHPAAAAAAWTMALRWLEKPV